MKRPNGDGHTNKWEPNHGRSDEEQSIRGCKANSINCMKKRSFNEVQKWRASKKCGDCDMSEKYVEKKVGENKSKSTLIKSSNSCGLMIIFIFIRSISHPFSYTSSSIFCEWICGTNWYMLKSIELCPLFLFPICIHSFCDVSPSCDSFQLSRLVSFFCVCFLSQFVVAS